MSNPGKILFGICVSLLVAGCVEQEDVVVVPDAENILFTSAGDLLVSGGKGLYQVESTVNPDGSTAYQKTKVYSGPDCAFTGIAQSGDWVFAICKGGYIEWEGLIFSLVVDTHLVAANLNERPLDFKALDEGLDYDPLDEIVIPNGLAFTPTGHLLVADENFFATSSVGRITLDYSEGRPGLAGFEKDWLDNEYGFEAPNGVRVDGNTLYVSDVNKVRRLFFDAQGEVPLSFLDENGNEVSNRPEDNEFYQGGWIIDDIMPYCGGIAVTHFFQGKLVFQTAAGEKYQTPPFSFDGPSSIAVGGGQSFDGNDLLVTEKGILLENNSNYGNRLTRVPLDYDLLDPATCEALNELDQD
ncbi:MAG: hypothetical protein CSB48_03480 [Proteobacteria bacterium]|nr:MAG: hypothetical protein CSB48_03480 [Pseudomonadota bacterium]